jgi:hypothetical protein
MNGSSFTGIGSKKQRYNHGNHLNQLNIVQDNNKPARHARESGNPGNNKNRNLYFYVKNYFSKTQEYVEFYFALCIIF